MQITSTPDGYLFHNPSDPSAPTTPKNRSSITSLRVYDLKIARYKRITSTNTKAYRFAEQGAPEWTVVVSDVQTQGRGRAGKKWESPAGGLWLSILLRPSISAPQVPLLQFLASNATRQAIERETGIKPLVKWPNDLILESGKLGGILVETKTKGNNVAFAIVGIGLNVNQERKLLPTGATSLRLVTGIKFELTRLLKAIVSELRAGYVDLGEPDKIVEVWWKNCVHRPRRIQVQSPRGIITGISKGVDTEGNLLVETENHKLERITEGTLKVLD